ncbi:sensor histidine kinase [Cryobacterium tagatosivorans]|uniref:Histidine kinase n=1 Tax=Cryobacterium tagatosivorans TaxID=1259199 RepID=A0A4R8UI59_9MICO|nr:ATP-binding protein [Cryobacterium tagatosivorans]TFB53882.1 histidine kinase [Cryobacterium tagatosivorans]
MQRTFTERDRLLKERDRLLRRAARATGLAGAATALLCMLVPGGLAPDILLGSVLLVLAMAGWLYLLGRTGAIRWVVMTVLTGMAAILLIGFGRAPEPRMNLVEESVIAAVAAGAMSSVAIVLVVSLSRLVTLGSVLGFTVASVVAATVTSHGTIVPLALTISGWFATTLGGWWMGQSIPRAMQRIAAIGRAHRAERHASELEAQRRQDARLLHDTVLATLTLLAHSGVGVSPDALREQAGDDARLLRQLRLGGLPTPRRSGVYTLEPASESTLGNTLESVKQRFGRMGLEVDWHGSGQVLLPSTVLDSFLLALGECLENVRRHSGVKRADVTITDDDTTVRAMVTDAGIGFDLDGVGAERLGFTESVVARLRDVGGNARLFSSPGSGTTVVLEVPK